MANPTHSDVLWCKIHLAEGRLTSASNAFWNHPDLAQLLPPFLIQLHRVMKSGISLMRTARDRALILDGDLIATQVASYLEAHIEEEKGHDEWLLSDIESLGISSNSVTRAVPCPGVVSLLGAQYFWMLHFHPLTIFGYLIVLEGYPPLVQQLEEIRVRTGLPASAFRCLRSHAEDDPEHIAELNRTLDRMPLSPEQESWLALSAFSTIDAVASILEDLLAWNNVSPDKDDTSQEQRLSPSHA